MLLHGDNPVERFFDQFKDICDCRQPYRLYLHGVNMKKKLRRRFPDE